MLGNELTERRTTHDQGRILGTRPGSRTVPQHPMVSAEELCTLLRDAEQRYSTLSCEFAVRFHPEIAAKAERQQIAAGKIKLAGISADEYFRGWDELAGAVVEYRALVWVKRPGCYREQDFDEDDPQLLVCDGSRWSRRDSANTVSTGISGDGERPAAAMGRYAMCVNPEPLPERLDFEVLGAGERVGRPVICARACRLPPRPAVNGMSRVVAIDLSSWFPLPVFSNGEDDYVVEIDAETGVILRIASVFESQDWMAIEAVKAEFDQPMPESTFTIP